MWFNGSASDRYLLITATATVSGLPEGLHTAHKLRIAFDDRIVEYEIGNWLFDVRDVG